MKRKRVVWKEGHLVSLKLRDDLYTVGQMLRSPYMRFFNISSRNGLWENIDLNKVDPLFCVAVGQVVIQRMVDQKIKTASVKASELPFEKYFIKPNLNFDQEFPFKGGRLIELDPNIGSANARVVKANLSLEKDREIIEKHELTNMWGADDLTERLVTYFDTGEDRNSLKAKVFGL